MAFSLSGSLNCTQIEYPLVSMSILNCSGMSSLVSLSEAVLKELPLWEDGEQEIRYLGSDRQTKRFRQLDTPSSGCELNLSETRGSFIVTGDLGGLGLLTGRVLSRLGARRIVLVSRSGTVAREGQGLETDLMWLQRESGSEILVRRCDVSNESALMSLLSELRSMEGGISGVVHSAGVLRDALLRRQGGFR